MSANAVATIPANSAAHSASSGKLLLGTGLAFASLILVPAVAMQLGLGASMTGALRIALMRASSRAINGTANGSEDAPAAFSCH
jgi:hypothetical protein